MLEIRRTSEMAEYKKVGGTQINGAKLQIKSTNVYVPVVTFSVNENFKYLENIKQGIKRTCSSNKYRSEETTQTKDNILYYI